MGTALIILATIVVTVIVILAYVSSWGPFWR